MAVAPEEVVEQQLPVETRRLRLDVAAIARADGARELEEAVIGEALPSTTAACASSLARTMRAHSASRSSSGIVAWAAMRRLCSKFASVGQSQATGVCVSSQQTTGMPRRESSTIAALEYDACGVCTITDSISSNGTSVSDASGVSGSRTTASEPRFFER